MLRLNRLMRRSCVNTRPPVPTGLLSIHEEEKLTPLPSRHSARTISSRFLDIYQFANKDAIAKERARIKDEMNRGYFADMSELKQHGGKIALASKNVVPALDALKFPDFEVTRSDGGTFKLPISCKGSSASADAPSVPKVSMVCLSFRAYSQAMIESWSQPFAKAFGDSKDVHLYEVSFIDSWLLCRSPIKQLLLRVMRKTKCDGGEEALERQVVYSFGDHYYFRKELKILNLLTGYVFLLDKFGRVRWQGFGSASQEEVSSLLSGTSLLLEEQE